MVEAMNQPEPRAFGSNDDHRINEIKCVTAMTKVNRI